MFYCWTRKLSVETKFGSTACWLAATTGKAAHLIKGRTYHSLLKIFPRWKGPLGSGSRERLQDAMKDVRLLIIDEFSMINAEDLFCKRF